MKPLAVFLRQHFEVSRYPGVYVLGCFARRVTLYSQQVRALNLVYSLCRAGKLAAGSKVAVIGGGAAGLTAAVAAARRGARVWLWDKLQGPMELQQNNRQRWIHPFIYDWPYLDEFADRPDITLPPFKGDAANLPLLTWSADYAANVAQEIESQWRYFHSLYGIMSHWNVEGLRVRRGSDGTSAISWVHNDKSLQEKADLVILAVGFGLESRECDCDSYWMEDNLDGALRKPKARPSYLVSGAGDGAFTDLMRLCMRRFRQDEILSLLLNSQGIDEVIRELRRSPKDSPRSVFNRLPINEELLKAAKQTLRSAPHRPNIFLVSPRKNLYGTQTSTLNRLGILVLQKLAQKPPALDLEPRKPVTVFTHIVGRTGKPKRILVKSGSPEQGESSAPTLRVPVYVSKGHKVPSTVPRCFHGVIRRHGPKSVLRSEFNAIWRDTAALRSNSRSLSNLKDQSRVPQWPAAFFEPQRDLQSAHGVAGSALTGTVTPGFVQAVKKFGVWADTLSIHKSVRSDGSSNVTFTIERLSVVDKPLHGVYFYYGSSAGLVDRVACTSSSPDFELSWDDRSGEQVPSRQRRSGRRVDFTQRVEHARRRARVLSGFVWFKNRPLTIGGQLSFSLSFRLINGDALSSWEFNQMYSAEEQLHVDRKPVGDTVEYFARTVWFPVKTLKLRITLPTALRETPTAGVFEYVTSHRIGRSDVIRQVQTASGMRNVLQYYPAQRSPWRRKRRIAIQKQQPPPFDKNFFKSVAPHTWELAVTAPMVGSCYSVEWKLPQSKNTRASEIVLPDVIRFRETLLRFRSARDMRKLRGRDLARLTAFRAFFLQLWEALREILHIPESDFEVSLMTYDERRRRLLTTYGIKNGRGLDRQKRNFWLPFGLGLAGSCFKQGSAFISQSEHGDQGSSDLNYYLPIAGRRRPEFLASIPLYHPIFERIVDLYRATEVDRKHLYLDLVREPSRTSVGVINVTSVRHFHRAIEKTDLHRVLKSCQTFCADIHQSLHASTVVPS